jgi:DNA polymerase IV
VSGAPAAILHVDMDAFYASVEQRDRPELAGKALIVGGAGRRGVVAAASYEVRRFGVRSAMPTAAALKLCPSAICIPPRMARYQEVSRDVFAVFYEFTPLIEGLSLDEAFLDVSASQRLLGDAAVLAMAIKGRIREVTGLAASVGLAPNKLLAKIASDLGKPDGFLHIRADNLAEIIDPLPVERLPGIGPKTLVKVHALGIRTLADLRCADPRRLWPVFGSESERMRERAQGIDDRAVVPDREEKSIGAEETYAEDLLDSAAIRAELTRLADRTATRLRAHKLWAGVVAVKIRRGDFTTYSRQRKISPPTNDTGVILRLAIALFEEWRREQPGASIRLLGVGAAKLGAAAQFALFAAETARDGRLDAAVDRIRGKFGAPLLTRASLLAPAGDSRRRR